MITRDKKVTLSWKLAVGGQILRKYSRKTPYTYVHGRNSILPGFEKQLEGLKPGDKKAFTVNPDEGFGQIDTNAFAEVPKSRFDQGPLREGMSIIAEKDNGKNKFKATISKIAGETVILDLNHPLAGKKLDFDVTILGVL